MDRRTRTTEVNGATLHYEVAGHGKPLVLIHAGICDSRIWERQLEAFAEHYGVIRYDMRGFGMTNINARRAFSNHEDLRGLLDNLGVGARTCSAARWERRPPSTSRIVSARSSWSRRPSAASSPPSSRQESWTS